MTFREAAILAKDAEGKRNVADSLQSVTVVRMSIWIWSGNFPNAYREKTEKPWN